LDALQKTEDEKDRITTEALEKRVKKQIEYYNEQKNYSQQLREMIKQNELDMLNDKIGSYGAQLAEKEGYFSMEKVLEEQKMALKNLAFKTSENILRQQIIQGGIGLKSMKKLMEQELKNYLITQGVQEGMKALQFTALGLGYLATSDPRAGMAFTAAAEHAAVATAFGVGAAAIGAGKSEGGGSSSDISNDVSTAVTEESSVKVLEAPYPDNATLRFMLGDELNKAI